MEHRGATNIHLLSVRNNTSYVGLFLGDIANKQDTVELLPAFTVSISGVVNPSDDSRILPYRTACRTTRAFLTQWHASELDHSWCAVTRITETLGNAANARRCSSQPAIPDIRTSVMSHHTSRSVPLRSTSADSNDLAQDWRDCSTHLSNALLMNL
jgi:hypothetical protein